MKFVVLVCFLLTGCSFENNSKEYEAYWYETYFKLTLNGNQTFKYQYEGHLGFSEYDGTYKIIDDTIVLSESTKELEELRFLIYDDDCLVELESTFDYCIRSAEK